MLDHENYNLAKDLETCIQFIKENIAENKNILVHCFAGISRSAAVVIAYLIRYYFLKQIK